MLSGSEEEVCAYVTSMCRSLHVCFPSVALVFLDSSASMSSTSFPVKQLDLVDVVFTCVQTPYVPASDQGLNLKNLITYINKYTWLKNVIKYDNIYHIFIVFIN